MNIFESISVAGFSACAGAAKTRAAVIVARSGFDLIEILPQNALHFGAIAVGEFCPPVAELLQ
jgi:hypothetical protein